MPASLPARIYRGLSYRAFKFASSFDEKRWSQAGVDQYDIQLSPHRLPGVHLFSLGGMRQIPQQSLVILSFLRHCGIPESWNVISDGSLTGPAIDRLRSLHPCIVPRVWTEFLTDQNRPGVEAYGKINVMGRKLAVVSGLPADRTCVYTDTDIVFFPGAARLRELLRRPGESYFLHDRSRSSHLGLAPFLVTQEEFDLPRVNAGFFVQAKPLPWTEPLRRLVDGIREHPELANLPTNREILEQTVVHLACHLGGALPLNADYVVDMEDAYEWRDAYAQSASTALRHYVTFVRYKFWRQTRPYLK